MNANQLVNIVKSTAYTKLIFNDGGELRINGADTSVEGDLILIYPKIRELEYRILYSSPTLDKYGTSTPQELLDYWELNGFFLTNGNIVADDRVEFRADLPITIGTPVIGAINLVEKPTKIFGVYTTYQSGLYIKENDTGVLDDWRRLNIKPKFTDTEFAIVKTADPSIQLKVNLSLLTGNRTVSYQDMDGVVAIKPEALTLSANTTLTKGSKVICVTTPQITIITYLTPENTDSVNITNDSGGVIYINGNGALLGDSLTQLMYDGENIDMVYNNLKWNI